MLIIGSIIRTITLEGSRINFDTAGTALFMAGFVALIAGWIIVSKQNPPSQ